jgi:hypothetical protein
MVSKHLGLSYTIKALVMYGLLCLDLMFLCTAEWENIGFLKNLLKKDKLVVLISFIAQTLFQIILSLMVLVLLGGTYLFKVGMIGVLFKQFKRVLQIHALYIGISAFVGILRLQALCFPGVRGQNDVFYATLWNSSTMYFPLSVSQKFVAAIYYLGNLQLLRELATPRWYRKEDWVAMYRQQTFHGPGVEEKFS